MLRQMSRRQHIEVALNDTDGARELANILGPNEVSVNVPVPLEPSEVSKILEKAPKLLDEEYIALLHYLQCTGRPYRSFDNFPHPSNALILPPQAQHPLRLKRDGRTFSCERSHKGNSAIQYYNPLAQAHDTGSIQAIWRLPLDGLLHTFIVVRPHQALSTHEEAQAPFIHYPGFMSRIVDMVSSAKLAIIEPNHIITHLTTFKRPAGTYGIGRDTLVVCWALNRGRR